MMNSGPLSFCDIVLVLDAAVDAGEDIYRALEEFWNGVTDEMVAGLPEELSGPAEVLLVVVEGMLSAPVALVSSVTGGLDRAIDTVAVACRAV